MRLTLVGPATDDPPTLHRCLEAVRAASDPPDEVVVVTVMTRGRSRVGRTTVAATSSASGPPVVTSWR